MKKLLLILIAMTALLASCSDEESTTGPDDNYDIPSTYSYEGVDYSTQTERLEKLAEIKSMLSGSNEVNATAMQSLWDQNLASHVSIENTAFFTALFSAAEADSKAGDASDGQGGYVSNGEKTYLINSTGLEYAQLFEKGMMGAFMLHNVVHYTSDDMLIDAVDKETALSNWDQAFGLFSASNDFPESTEGLSFVAKYCNSSNDLTGLNNTIMNDGYLLGRSAIMNDDNESLAEAVETVRDSWERVFAATAIHYLNGAKNNYTDDAVRIHQLSEFWGFVWSIQFNPGHSKAYQEALEKVGDNLWTVTIIDLNEAIDILATEYDMEEIKADL